MYICTKLHNQIRIISKLLILFFILNYLNFLFKVDVYIKQIRYHIKLLCYQNNIY